MPVHRTLLHFGLNGVGPTGLEPSVGQIWNPQSCDLAKMRTAALLPSPFAGPPLPAAGLTYRPSLSLGRQLSHRCVQQRRVTHRQHTPVAVHPQGLP